MTLLHRSTESETRLLTRMGVILVLGVVIAIAVYLVVNPFGRKPRDIISLAIETPYVGQGVAVGTPVIMHGVKIGQVESVSSIPGGGVHLQTSLQPGPARGLTDAMQIDYRPSNYFGVTGINVVPGQSGRPLRSGMQINLTPKGNFSLQALLYRLGELSNGVFNDRLISVIERATRYADGLDPLLETMLMVANSVTKVQTVSTARLLNNATGVSVAFPSFADALISTGDKFLHTSFVHFDVNKYKETYKFYPTLDDRLRNQLEDNARFMNETIANDKFYDLQLRPLFEAGQIDLFGRAGYLLGSHIDELFPLLESVRTVTDAVPKILSPESFAYTMTELRKRFERMYAGSGDQHALQVRLILDRLPGIAAPIGGIPGGTP